MDWIEVPEQARRGRPYARVVDMGPPVGHEGTIGRIQVLQTGEDSSGFRTHYTYYKPTEAELEWLKNGGFIEFAQYGYQMQPQFAAVWSKPLGDKNADQRPE